MFTFTIVTYLMYNTSTSKLLLTIDKTMNAYSIDKKAQQHFQ